MLFDAHDHLKMGRWIAQTVVELTRDAFMILDVVTDKIFTEGGNPLYHFFWKVTITYSN